MVLPLKDEKPFYTYGDASTMGYFKVIITKRDPTLELDQLIHHKCAKFIEDEQKKPDYTYKTDVLPN